MPITPAQEQEIEQAWQDHPTLMPFIAFGPVTSLMLVVLGMLLYSWWRRRKQNRR